VASVLRRQPVWSSAICRKPFGVPGARLVISSRTLVVRTGSKVIVVGWFVAVAQVIFGFRTGR
jgi:hypothetical protein